ncbi:MAG: DNA recombination protein RmuC [Kistimonas sp.]|nr:DNA recombination protein RmuC [Kistimonas sp.]
MPISPVSLFLAFLAFLVFLTTSWLCWRTGASSARSRLLAEEQKKQHALDLEVSQLRQQADHLHEEKQQLTANCRTLESRLQESMRALEQSNLDLLSLRKDQEAAAEKLGLLKQAESRLGQQFENLANRIFDHKVSRLSEQTRESMTGVLGPLRQQLDDFRKQVASSYDNEAQQRHSLKDEITSLRQLNQRMSEEALNLTRALKGDKKLQGNWGELVLDRVLETSGLREGHEYVRQVSFQDDAGQRQQPDVIVHLPDGRDVILDSKVSLVDHSLYVAAETESEKNKALARHVQCLRNHIRSLSDKSYQDVKDLRTLDYVLMFIPVEAAFYSAIEHRPELFQEALDSNIMIVSPTNLLVTLRTIENIWRYEQQNRNAQLIADKAAALYDKLRGFTEDMQKLGNQLTTAQKTWTGAMNKFSSGRGNVVRQAQQFIELGVKVKKTLPPELVDRAAAETPLVEADEESQPALS